MQQFFFSHYSFFSYNRNLCLPLSLISLKKGDALLREKPSVKYEFIHKNCSQFRVEKMCDVLGVSKSGYFKWLKRPKSDRKKQHEKLSQKIFQTHLEFEQRYGGVKVSERTVSRIMTKNQWLPRYFFNACFWNYRITNP